MLVELSMLLTVGLACSTLAMPWGQAEVVPEGPAPRVAQAPTRTTPVPLVRYAVDVVVSATRPSTPTFAPAESSVVPAASNLDAQSLGLRLLGPAVLARVHH